MHYPSKIISKFLSKQELDIIEHVVETNRSEATTYYDNNTNLGHNAVTYSIFLQHPKYQEIQHILVPRLREHFGEKLQLPNTHILNAYVPYGIHNDVMSANFDPSGPDDAAWTFIIPLEDYDSNTVVFEQEHDTIKTIIEWVDATNPVPHNIDDEFHQKYLTHTDRIDMRWLTPESVFPWRKGDLFATSRRKFHTSDNFLANGLECKRAIVIWSTIPKS